MDKPQDPPLFVLDRLRAIAAIDGDTPDRVDLVRRSAAAMAGADEGGRFLALVRAFRGASGKAQSEVLDFLEGKKGA